LGQIDKVAKTGNVDDGRGNPSKFRFPASVKPRASGHEDDSFCGRQIRVPHLFAYLFDDFWRKAGGGSKRHTIAAGKD
jgi:hypothetical protein